MIKKVAARWTACALLPLIATSIACGHSHAPHHGGPLGHRFDDPESWSARWDDPARDEWQRPAEVIEAMAIEPGMALVDLGAGTGYFLPHLAAAAGPDGAVEALDVEAPMVDWLKNRIARDAISGASARLVPFDDPQLPAASVDRVLIVNTWHHIPERPTYGAHLTRALKPGGAVVIVDYALDSPVGPPAEMRLSPESVVADLEAAGLKAAIIPEALPRQYIVVGRLP